MKNFIQKFLFLSFFILTQTQGYAQGHVPILPQDSLALVALYNSTNGAQWLDDSNWLVTNVDTWKGVSVVGNRVQTLSLNNNNLVGSLPTEFCDLSDLEYIYLQSNTLSGNLPSCMGSLDSIVSINLSNNNFSGAFPAVFATNMPNLSDIWITNNSFTDFPDLSSVTSLTTLYVDQNILGFDDVVPNASIPNLQYVYNAQSSGAPTAPDVYVNVLYPFTLQVSMGGTGNVYQWKNIFFNGGDVVDNDRFSGSTTNTLVNQSAASGDGGFYYCIVTNPGAPLLSFQITSSTVHVIDNRIRPVITASDSSMYCGDTLLLQASNSSGLPVHYRLLDSTIISDHFAPPSNHTYQIIAYNDGDTSYLPAADTFYVQVQSHAVIPIFSIANDLPIYAGEELNLSVQSVSGVSYVWTTPQGIVDSSAIVIPAIDSSNVGLYKVNIHEGSCVYDTLQINVTLAIDEDVIIYELITPNGDGDNETFFIKNIEKIPSVDVAVFNVWNQAVYHNENYKNEWDGGGLPVGTYYYLVKVKEWDKVYKGNLYLKR
ncbi:MAG: C-terminal target protein [Chitinophagaceae bacterium]|nr:C-terminal target protein [Chitinophagaceae bacterium]